MAERATSGPERTCVGCRRRLPKADLLRIVRRGDGSARFDPTGSAPGRGAYVHARSDCIRRAIARGALARALRTSAEPGWAGRLVDELEPLSGPGEGTD